MPVNPKVVLLLTRSGDVWKERNNIGNNLNIVTVWDDDNFDAEAEGLPYVADSPPVTPQVLAMKKKA